jgi:hypothetical protein
MLGLSISACGGGSGSNETNADSSGDTQSELLISLTDAEGDFLTYLVNVDSITLTRSNGATVEALPISTAVDFAQYVEVTELLSIATIPTGRYESAEITLNFTNAQITVQDEQGNPIVADAQDSNGDPLTTLAVSIDFEDHDGFTIRPGIPAQVTLDFDLDASNEIVIDNGEATVTVHPIFLADTLLEEPKPFHLRGLLGSVAVDDNVFTINLRPFRMRTGHFGSARVHVTEQTRYEINQQFVPNEDGLNSLAALGAGNAVLTHGQWDRTNHRYTATHVFAGSSVPWHDSDMLRGTVISRSGNTVNIRGAIIELAEGHFVFNDTVTVNIGDETRVLVLPDMANEATIADISVGSSVSIIGEVTGENAMDATQGLIRVHLSSVAGSVAAAGPLTVDLEGH